MTNSNLLKVIVLLSLLNILAVFMGVRYLHNQTALQFGGKENYILAKQVFKNPEFAKRQKESLTQTLAGFNTGTPIQDSTTNTTPTTPDTTTQTNTNTTTTPAMSEAEIQQYIPTLPTGTLSKDQIAAIKKDAYVEGDAGAKYTIVEYSDPECPFCIRHFNDGTIANTIAAFPGDVNHIYKVVQGVNHQGTAYKSQAILCAGQLGGQDAYVGMYKKILSSSTVQVVVPTSKVMDFAKELNVDSAKLESCISKGETMAVYNANWAELGGLVPSQMGTPGNLVINNESGKWVHIAGAYPTEFFQYAIKNVLN